MSNLAFMNDTSYVLPFIFFNLSNIFEVFVSSLLTFVREVMGKDTSVLCAFRTNILRYISIFFFFFWIFYCIIN